MEDNIIENYMKILNTLILLILSLISLGQTIDTTTVNIYSGCKDGIPSTVVFTLKNSDGVFVDQLVSNNPLVASSTSSISFNGFVDFDLTDVVTTQEYYSLVAIDIEQGQILETQIVFDCLGGLYSMDTWTSTFLDKEVLSSTASVSSQTIEVENCTCTNVIEFSDYITRCDNGQSVIYAENEVNGNVILDGDGTGIVFFNTDACSNLMPVTFDLVVQCNDGSVYSAPMTINPVPPNALPIPTFGTVAFIHDNSTLTGQMDNTISLLYDDSTPINPCGTNGQGRITISTENGSTISIDSEIGTAIQSGTVSSSFGDFVGNESLVLSEITGVFANGGNISFEKKNIANIIGQDYQSGTHTIANSQNSATLVQLDERTNAESWVVTIEVLNDCNGQSSVNINNTASVQKIIGAVVAGGFAHSGGLTSTMDYLLEWGGIVNSDYSLSPTNATVTGSSGGTFSFPQESQTVDIRYRNQSNFFADAGAETLTWSHSLNTLLTASGSGYIEDAFVSSDFTIGIANYDIQYTENSLSIELPIWVMNQTGNFLDEVTWDYAGFTGNSAVGDNDDLLTTIIVTVPSIGIYPLRLDATFDVGSEPDLGSFPLPFMEGQLEFNYLY